MLNLDMASAGGATTDASVVVTGGGSEVRQLGSSTLTVGHASTGSATITVENNGVFATGTGAATIHPTGTINVNSFGGFGFAGDLNLLGTINLNGGELLVIVDPDFSTGTFNYTSGRLTIGSSQTLSNARLAELQVAPVTAGKELRTLGLATVPTNSTLRVDGGSLDASGGLRLEPDSTLEAHSPSMVLVDVLEASAGSTIDATNSNMVFGNVTEVNGIYINGTLRVGGSTVFLVDANDAVLDSQALVTLGVVGGGGAIGGVLTAFNGITIASGGDVTGAGTINTTNSAATPLTNNGAISGTSLDNPITLTGFVKGVGTCDNCVMTGTDAPGLSTAAVTRGSVRYQGVLEIELEGLTAGSGFDQINHTLGAGVAQLGGTLDVKLARGFRPFPRRHLSILDGQRRRKRDIRNGDAAGPGGRCCGWTFCTATTMFPWRSCRPWTATLTQTATWTLQTPCSGKERANLSAAAARGKPTSALAPRRATSWPCPNRPA